MSKLILSIDLDYCFPQFLNVFNDGVDDSKNSMNKFLDNANKLHLAKVDKNRARLVNKIINNYKKIEIITEHDEILKMIDKSDIVVNLDYHEDIDYEIEELFCGNWANDLEFYQHIDSYQPEILGTEFDKVIFCCSFQWTPKWDWIENKMIKEKIDNLHNLFISSK